MNDPSVGQGRGDEAGEEKISRHLVGDLAGIRRLLTEKPGIGFSKLLKIAADEVPDSFGESLARGAKSLHPRPGAAEAHNDVAEMIEFTRAHDL